jgi:N utilization substance protein A
MKGSRVQAIIRELRGEKIDIIEWSDEPSVFAANALSPAKVNKVRITDIDNRQMEVIVNEDQLSLAIGKRGQNVRLATKLVGWNIDIRSEEEIKREVTEQMGALIASGASVPLSVIEGVTVQQTDALAEHGINDIDALTQTSVDDLVEFLDLSLDEAEVILNAAKAVVAMRDKTLQAGGAEERVESEYAEAAETADSESEELGAGDVSLEVASEETAADESKSSADSTAEGYDEAVEARDGYIAEQEILAQYSADPVALTEAEPTTEDALILQEPGRDLRPDTIVPAPDVTSAEAAAIESLDELNALANDEGVALEEVTRQAASGTTGELKTSAPAILEDAASSESTDEEKQDASKDAAK